MKKIILMALAAMPCIGLAQSVKYKVTAKIANVTSVNQAHLLYYQGSTPSYGTAKLENGVYVFEGTAPGPVVASFFLDNKGIGYTDGKFQDKLQIRLENGDISIVAPDSVKYAKVAGGAYNKDYKVYKDFLSKEVNALENLNARYIIGFQNKQAKEELAAIRQKQEEEYKLWQQRNYEYVKTHPNSYSSIDALSSVLNAQTDMSIAQPLYDKLSPKIKETPAGKELMNKLIAIRDTKIGSMAPLFTQADTSGKQIGPKNFRGKYLLLDFWASWCGPCRAENPNYIANYKKYHEKGLEMLGVSLDKEGDKDKWIAAIHKDGLLWPQVSDLKYWNGEVTKMYGIRSIPQNFLIDPQGKIIASNLRGEELSKKLAALFDK